MIALGKTVRSTLDNKLEGTVVGYGCMNGVDINGSAPMTELFDISVAVVLVRLNQPIISGDSRARDYSRYHCQRIVVMDADRVTELL